jgi:predicted RNA-binding protein with PUA-like domain
MAYWLLKSEPSEFSFADLTARGAKGDSWTGVRNYGARNNLRAMKKGDRFFFYHTGGEKQVVGVGEIIGEAFADPTADKSEDWSAVTTVAVESLTKPVTLAAIKADPGLAGMALVKQGRLSVLPVTAAEWKLICKLGGVKT